jgi:hypothetical protein
MDHLAEELNLQSWEDWYKVKAQDVHKAGGGGLLVKYGTLSKMIASIYPEYPFTYYYTYCLLFIHPWDMNRFHSKRIVSHEHSLQRTLAEKIGQKLGIKSIDDWYQVTNKQFIAQGGATLLSKYRNSLSTTLKTLFPEYLTNPFFLAYGTGISGQYINLSMYLKNIGITLITKKNSWNLLPKSGTYKLRTIGTK